MAAPRRVQLTAFSNEVTLAPVSNSQAVQNLPVRLGPVEPAAVAEPQSANTARIELVLFESDEQRCPEFYYPDLINVKVTDESSGKSLDEVFEDKERTELEALARKFEEKYGGASKRRTDRVQDLVDIGYGYDETDSFIDNSEAYDELVPASLTTKHGGFYINSGTLQFRQVSDESDEDDDFEEKLQPKWQKEKADRQNHKKRKGNIQRGEDDAKNSKLLGMPPEKRKKKKNSKPLSIDVMLKKFHKEKLQQLQMINTSVDRDSIIQAEVPEESILADPLLSLIGSTSADDLLKAVKAVDQDFDLEKLLTEDQDTGSTTDENQKSPVCQPVKPPTSLPDGLPPVLELCIQELAQTIKEMEGVNKMEVFAPKINEVLLEVTMKSKELPDKVCSRIFSFLASQLSCKKGTLLKRAKRLHLHYLDDQLQDWLQKLEEAVTRSMPEQIDRFNDHCQAHSEARAAKMEAEKEQKTVDGSEDEEEDKSGKRVFGPRKRFRWTEEIRELLHEVVKLKMNCYELETHSHSSLEEYLKNFLEANVKPLWPKGWMQSRILLIESRRVHGHITGVVARKKSITIPKPKKVDFPSKNVGDVQSVQAVKRPSLCTHAAVTLAQQKDLGLPFNAMNATPCAADSDVELLNAHTSAYFSLSQLGLQQQKGEAGKSVLGGPLVFTDGERPFNGPQMDSEESSVVSPEGSLPTNSRVTSQRTMSAPKRLPAWGEKTQMLTLMAPPAAAEKDSAVVQGVARLLTTTSFCKAPVSEAVAAVEGSCGDPALPTPSLSHQAASYSNVLQSVGLTNFIPLHALPFPGLTLGRKPSGHGQTCKDSILAKPASGSFQYGLTHADGSQLHPEDRSPQRKLQ